MDLHRIRKITIAYLDFQDITSHRTGNPVAEDELPELLRKSIKAGVSVEITDPEGNEVYRLTLDQDDQFQMVSRA